MTADASLRVAPDGAWCWFQDPRAVYVHRQHERTYAGWITREGVLETGAHDHRTGESQRFALKAAGEADDHSSCALLVRDDGRLMAFYARHNQTGLHCRTTARPEDISEWDDEVTVASTPRTTYCHPIWLRDEGRFYAFWRGEEWKPMFATSDDGVSWSPPRMLVREKGREAADVRPYIKIVADRNAAIHFAVTNGHPRDEPTNSVHHFRYERGGFFRADGTRIGDLGGPPVSLRDCDVAYDGKAALVRAWVWDIALDARGYPSIAYTRLPSTTDHRYCCARWDGSNWIDGEITPGGRWFPQTPWFRREREPHYSGGMAFKHADPSIVYVSRPIGGVFEIEKWTNSGDTSTWTPTAITRDSAHDNVRPVAAAGYAGAGDLVLWMRGRYVHYTNFRTEIRMAAEFAASRR
jgi:BNR repeat-containing family member